MTPTMWDIYPNISYIFGVVGSLSLQSVIGLFYSPILFGRRDPLCGGAAWEWCILRHPWEWGEMSLSISAAFTLSCLASGSRWEGSADYSWTCWVVTGLAWSLVEVWRDVGEGGYTVWRRNVGGAVGSASILPFGGFLLRWFFMSDRQSGIYRAFQVGRVFEASA